MDGHQHFFNFLRNRELNELYISIAIRNFAISMINIFIPIYLLKLGYSLAAVLIFIALNKLFHSLFTLPAAKISAKYGFKHSMLYSVPLLIIFYLLLYTLETYNWPLYALTVFFGLNNGLFWMGYHNDFCKFSNKENRGSEVSFAKIITITFQMIGPIIGGIILAIIGFKALFAAVCVLLIASTIPLFFSDDPHDKYQFSIKGFFKIANVKDTISFMAFGIESQFGAILWPIIIYLFIVDKYITIGLISSLSFLFSILFILTIGKILDGNKRKVLRIGAILNFLIWIIKFFIKTVFHVFIIDSIYGISASSTNVSFNAISYDKANKSNILKYNLFREFSINFGSSIMFMLLAFLPSVKIGILISMIASLLLLLY